MSTQDKTQPGLTEEARGTLDHLRQAGGFHDLQDAYRLAVAIALAEGLEPAPAVASRKTYLNIGSLDPDNSLRNAVRAIRDDHDERPVAMIERLAEAGIERLAKQLDDGRSMRELLSVYGPPADIGEH